MKPLIAIVGRPNVGKSTLFNKIVGKRIAIVEDSPGVTRDRIYADGEWLDYRFTLIDTGGIEPENEDIIAKQMRRQAELAIETAHVIIFIVDGRAGLTAADEEVADMLRRSKKPVVLAVNKIDHPKFEEAVYDFYSLGIGTPYGISAEQGLGIGDLLDEVVSYFERIDEEAAEENPAICIVGRPNVGKSSLLNALLGHERSIVSDVPGTTRDAIDTPFEWNGKNYTLIDTAGIRRKRSVEDETVERYSVIRSLAAIRRADIALIVVDAERGLSEQDVRIAGYVHEEGKASVVIVNKWDLIEKDTYTADKFKKDMLVDLAFMSYVPMLFISAKTGQRVNKVMELAEFAFEQNSTRIPTGKLNGIVSEAITMNDPPLSGGRRLRIYYATQVSTRPPTFVIFVNEPDLMHFSYKRYLENYIRKSFELTATPLRIIIRKRERNENN
ncbi:MAG: ribosome biogenesis GTPase Der [Clostridia bacterium]|nr:ribosome biogenesis GTPase Der [Clostridia bacterium]MBQ3938412.1 ribosome biogenesis GTPase Der [Clostridia bacterium]MBQ5487807.1 ribosome biogenesis GTPase Der [Clostridia bacterium]